MTIMPPFEPEWLRRPFWSESIRDFTEKANAALRAKDWRGVELQGIEFVDIARLLGGDDRKTPQIWGRNGLTLNADGYGVLTAEINRRLADDAR
jgi:type II restriction/modification system DNA methylase subunit YeeA